MADELVHYERHGQSYFSTPQEFLDELTYTSYRHNRLAHPQHEPRYWAEVFPAWEKWEVRFHAERTCTR